MMDSCNCLAKIFRKVRDQYQSCDISNFAIRMVQQKHCGKQYEPPTNEEIVDLIVGCMSSTTGERDVVLQLKP